MKTFHINYSEGSFYLQEKDSSGEFESQIYRWDMFNEFNSNHLWSLQYKENSRQRKYRWSSVSTHMIGGMIYIIKNKFESGCTECVARTPDVEVFFYKE